MVFVYKARAANFLWTASPDFVQAQDNTNKMIESSYIPFVIELFGLFWESYLSIFIT